MKQKTYIAIDLKSFYASVECMERKLDPMDTLLVVADKSRTEKTICLAVSPSLKDYGIPGRARLFEVVQRVKEVNAQRRLHAPGGKLVRKSADAADAGSASRNIGSTSNSIAVFTSPPPRRTPTMLIVLTERSGATAASTSSMKSATSRASPDR